MTEKEIKCDECDYSTSMEENLERHKKQFHNPEMTIKCDQCDYSTFHRGNLLQHKKESHTYEYNLTCKESKDCTFVTFQRDLLTQHVAENHPPKDRPKTKCPDCDAMIASSRKGNLYQHIRRVHKREPLEFGTNHRGDFRG